MILLLSASLSLAVLFLLMFIRAGKKGQFSDTYTPSVRILFDDDDEKELKTDSNTKK